MLSDVVSIHQPQYLPWVPYFDKILQADRFVLLDNVQFQKNGLQNRNQIKTATGASWLTVPVSHHFGQLINETLIADPRALTKHLKTLALNYQKSPYFDQVAAFLFPILESPHENLCDLNIDIVTAILRYLNYQGEIVRASSLSCVGKGSDLVLNICKAMAAHIYLSGQGGRHYMVMEDFDTSGIVVRFQQYETVEYPQLYPETGFVRGLSVVDLLFNSGPESTGIIEQGRRL